jgi:hypothetical protein
LAQIRNHNKLFLFGRFNREYKDVLVRHAKAVGTKKESIESNIHDISAPATSWLSHTGWLSRAPTYPFAGGTHTTGLSSTSLC